MLIGDELSLDGHERFSFCQILSTQILFRWLLADKTTDVHFANIKNFYIYGRLLLLHVYDVIQCDKAQERPLSVTPLIAFSDMDSK